MWIDNFRDDLKHLGFAKAGARAGYKLVNRAVHWDILRFMDLTTDSLDPRFVTPVLPGGYDGRFLSRAEASALPEQFGTVLTRAFVDTALAKGDDVFTIFDGATCAAFGWYSRRPTIIRDDLELRFDPRWVYMYHGYTRPEYRGERLHALGIARAVAACVEDPAVKGIISITEGANYRTYSSVSRLGFTFRGTIYRVGIGRLSIIGQSRWCDDYGVRVTTVKPRKPA